MEEASCLEQAPAEIVARVLKTKAPTLISARKGEQGVLLPFTSATEPLVQSHGQVITARVRDLKKSPDMAMYCMQVGMSRERDAITFIDDDDDPVLALVGVRRYQKWAKAKPKPVSRSPRGSPPARPRPRKKG
jgi:hypothetical protein